MRVRLDIPEELPFATEIRIRISDVNYGGHLGNDSVLSLVHEARLRFFASHGWSELDLGGVGTVMTDAAVQYLSQGVHGQRLRVEVGAAEVGRSGFDLLYRLTDTETGVAVALAKTGIVAFDYKAQKTCRLPEAVAATLRATSP